MKILILEPFFGGSHKQWAEGYKKYSKHSVEILSLPARRWKWRMHGGAITLAEKFLEAYSKASVPDAILVSDMMDLSIFQSLTKHLSHNIPTAIFFHENQMSYPLSPRDSDIKEKRELHYGFINVVSALCADKVFFNSDFHRDTFLNETQSLLSKFSKEEAKKYFNKIKNKSNTLFLGIDLEKLESKKKISKDSNVPLILWNHRWEFDKNPELFFNTLFKLDEHGIDFELAVLGEQPKFPPDIFAYAKQKLSSKIVHWGYVESFEDYKMWLHKADILPMTSNQEFFGISFCEAVLCGCIPLLPNRLTYPELMPKKFHGQFFYDNEQELLDKLLEVTSNKIPDSIIEDLKSEFKKFSWEIIANNYDKHLEELWELYFQKKTEKN